MPRYDSFQYNQKWSMWDTWVSTIGRGIRVAVITSQHRLLTIITAQHRLLAVITAQYRNIKAGTRG